MKDDVLPTKDSEFNLFLIKFAAALGGDPDKYGVTAKDVAMLQAVLALWAIAYPEHVDAQNKAHTATQNKDAARANAEEIVRGLAAKVHATPGADNTVRVSAGLKPRSDVRVTVGTPESRPLGWVEANAQGLVMVQFRDENSTKKAAKPKGAHGCEIWVSVGDSVPTSASGYQFVAMRTRTPYRHQHAETDVGKTAFYRLRWQNAKGQSGPWSDVVQAKIPL